MPMRVIIDILSTSPASQFYISAQQAQRFIYKMEHGHSPAKRDNKSRLMNDLYEVYLRNKVRMEGHYKEYIIACSIHHQAPSFYLSKAQLRKIIFSQ